MGTDIESPVLLSWHMPVWKQRLLRYRPYLIAAAALAPYAVFGMQYRQLWVQAALLLLAFGGIHVSTSISRRVVRTTTVEFTCKDQGVHIATMYPSTMLLLWKWLRSVERQERSSLVIAHEFEPGVTRLMLPREVQDRFVQIVHEHSNAQIIGFD